MLLITHIWQIAEKYAPIKLMYIYFFTKKLPRVAIFLLYSSSASNRFYRKLKRYHALIEFSNSKLYFIHYPSLSTWVTVYFFSGVRGKFSYGTANLEYFCFIYIATRLIINNPIFSYSLQKIFL